MLGAFALPVLAAADNGHLSQEDEVREVVFRHLLDNNEYSTRGESFGCYCLALGYRERKKTVDPSDLFKDILIDPSHAFMKRFADHKTVYKASVCREKVLDEVRDRRTGKPGLLLFVTDIAWISETEVKVTAEYHMANLASAGFTYIVKLQNGAWNVTDRHMDWISQDLLRKTLVSC